MFIERRQFATLYNTGGAAAAAATADITHCFFFVVAGNAFFVISQNDLCYSTELLVMNLKKNKNNIIFDMIF